MHFERLFTFQNEYNYFFILGNLKLVLGFTSKLRLARVTLTIGFYLALKHARIIIDLRI